MSDYLVYPPTLHYAKEDGLKAIDLYAVVIYSETVIYGVIRENYESAEKMERKFLENEDTRSLGIHKITITL